VEVGENGGGTRVAGTATGRLYLATGRSRAAWGVFKVKWKERRGKARENFGDLWCLGLVNAENGKV